MAVINKATFKKIANNIHPGWEFEEWFKWPPNVFALCSVILQRTGSYKLCLMECDWWNTENWQKDINNAADLWIAYANDLILEKDKAADFYGKSSIFTAYYDILKQEWDSQDGIDVDHLRSLGRLYTKEDQAEKERVRNFAKGLILVLAVADVTCAGLGFLGQPTSEGRKSYRLFETVANLLLNTTGSLSTVPKFYGIVLPKMRTPQAGLVIRSLSHHLTFHITEVEVIWRTFPWLNNHKQNLNILVVPYPTKIYKTDFKVIDENYHSVNYFAGNVANRDMDNKFLEALVKKVGHYAANNNEIDVLVLPEMSLTEDQYNTLLEKFSDKYLQLEDYPSLSLPVIVAGVIKKNEEEKTGNYFIDEAIHNEARIAIFFSGRWYDITQRKHHRWQLDQNQIEQYKLEGYFKGGRRWFEMSSITQRRLTILVPNGWLALSALICEDLARQEPVSEILRGIGPTLLMALLSDGPQLNSRWSSRYAGVLADDPGTAVLSLTSQGMADRSQPLDGKLIQEETENKYKATVGYWKDMIKGWKELVIEGKSDALLFTISSTFKEEFTIDGRTDGTCASVFKMDSINPKQVTLDYENEKQRSFDNKKKGIYRDPAVNSSRSRIDLGKWNDIRELSGLLFATTAIIDLLSILVRPSSIERSEKNEVKLEAIKTDVLKSIKIIIDLLLGKIPEKENKNDFVKEISQNISHSWREAYKVGIEAPFDADANEDLQACVEQLDKVIKIMQNEALESQKDFFNRLIKVCEDSIKPSKKNRLHRLTTMGILYDINTRLSNWKSRKDFHKGYLIEGMEIKEVIVMKDRVYKLLKTYLKETPIHPSHL